MSDSSASHTLLKATSRYKRPRTVKRSTRSCSECKRRKVRCQLSSEKNVTVCSGCIQRGTRCVASESRLDVDITKGTEIDQRLSRVETLLEKLVENEAKPPPQSSSTSTNSPEGRNEQYTPYTSVGSDNRESSNHSNSDKLVDVRNQVLVHRPEELNASISVAFPPSRPSKIEKVRQSLLALLPSQQDADLIAESTPGWVLAKNLFSAAHDLYKNDAPVSTFNMSFVSRQDPVKIARALLYIALCIQQLPPEFDGTRLQLYNTYLSIDGVADTYMSSVSILITSDDDFVATIVGLECLILQEIFHMNAGNFRRAWVSARRAVTMAQLLDLHKEYTNPLDGNDLMSSIAKKQMWRKVVLIERSLAIRLGLPCSTGDDCFGDENQSDLETNSQILFECKIYLIAGSIIARDQKDILAYAPTQQIDEELDDLSMKMPESFWAIPPLSIMEGSLVDPSQLERVLAQNFFFYLKFYLHLPFLFQANNDTQYDYSRHACITSVREILFRYRALRQNGQLVCRFVDFSAFTVTVILILSQLQLPSVESERLEDQQLRERDTLLIQHVIALLEKLSHSRSDPVARQSVEVLKMLLAFDTQSRNLRLTIPYFGTITLAQENQPGRQFNSKNQRQFTTPTQHVDAFDLNINAEDDQRNPAKNYAKGVSITFESNTSSSHKNPIDVQIPFDHINFDSIGTLDIRTYWPSQ